MAKEMIHFSIAFYNEIPLVFHSYIIDDSHVRFFYSCSSFRQEREMSSIIGRMNRLLHWENMLFFKHKGICEYDWGRVSTVSKIQMILQNSR